MLTSKLFMAPPGGQSSPPNQSKAHPPSHHFELKLANCYIHMTRASKLQHFPNQMNGPVNI